MMPPRPAAAPAARPTLYLTIFAAWFVTLAWFHPRLWALLDLAHTPVAVAALAFFIVFTEIAWLYGFYNIFVILFATWYRRQQRLAPAGADDVMPDPAPAVAILYLTCNDFVEESAVSCVEAGLSGVHVYVLDDSSSPESRAQVDGSPRIHRIVCRSCAGRIAAASRRATSTTVSSSQLANRCLLSSMRMNCCRRTSCSGWCHG